MNFKDNPFAGLSGVEICKKIYNPNRSYEEDVKEIEELIGGESNFKSCIWSPAKVPNDFGGTTYKIEVEDLEKTLFKQQNFSTRFISEDCTAFLVEEGLLISAKGAIDKELSKLCNYKKEVAKKEK